MALAGRVLRKTPGTARRHPRRGCVVSNVLFSGIYSRAYLCVQVQCLGHERTLQKMSDPVLTVCPECRQDTYVKQVTAAASTERYRLA